MEEFNDVQAVRTILAGLAMQGLITRHLHEKAYLNPEEIADEAVLHADALLAELAKKA